MSQSNPLVTTQNYYEPQYSASRGNSTHIAMHSGMPTKSQVLEKYQREV
jgi:hypothetical protein